MEEAKREELVRKIHKRLEAKGETLALAESCTGGMLSAAFIERPGISSVLMGSIVSYHTDLKIKILDVPSTLIKSMGEVSEPVALKMAEGAKAKTGAHWAIGVSGIAGPGGGTSDKPVGTVCFGIVGPGIRETKTQFFDYGERQLVQRASVLFALEHLNELI